MSVHTTTRLPTQILLHLGMVKGNMGVLSSEKDKTSMTKKILKIHNIIKQRFVSTHHRLPVTGVVSLLWLETEIWSDCVEIKSI